MPGHFEAMKMVCANKGSYAAKVGSSREVTQLVAHLKGRNINCLVELNEMNYYSLKCCAEVLVKVLWYLNFV